MQHTRKRKTDVVLGAIQKCYDCARMFAALSFSHVTANISGAILTSSGVPIELSAKAAERRRLKAPKPSLRRKRAHAPRLIGVSHVRCVSSERAVHVHVSEP